MRILHTSDWHLGKRLIDRERLSEQQEALAEIAAICEEKKVDVVLVAGDVFDTYLPPAEAEELFFRAVKEIAGEDRAVVAVSGNHDDGLRLAASAPLACAEGIFLFGGRGTHVQTGGQRAVRAAEAGDNYLILEKGEERLYLNLLPYPNEARLREERSEESYAEKARRWIAAGDERYDGSMPHILLSHLFVAGGIVSESERDVSLGGARAVPADLLPDFGYTALGHLHRPQRAGKYGRYSGSLLQYSFDEGPEKQVILLETSGKEIGVAEEIPLRAGKRLVRLEAAGAEEACKLLAGMRDVYIELTLHLKEPLTSRDTQALAAANEGLVSLITHVEGDVSAAVEKRSALGNRELFVQYYRSVYGEEPASALTEAFLGLLEET